jgi:hypothetical protein
MGLVQTGEGRERQTLLKKHPSVMKSAHIYVSGRSSDTMSSPTTIELPAIVFAEK